MAGVAARACVQQARRGALLRHISTSKRNSEVGAATPTSAAGAACEPSAAAAAPAADKDNWVSYGFDYKSQDADTSAHHASFFFSVTLCLIFGGFAWAYAPDVHMRDWAQREAFLELRRRERAGLPRIDPNYVSPKTVKLPKDEDLVDVEIVI